MTEMEFPDEIKRHAFFWISVQLCVELFMICVAVGLFNRLPPFETPIVMYGNQPLVILEVIVIGLVPGTILNAILVSARYFELDRSSEEGFLDNVELLMNLKGGIGTFHMLVLGICFNTHCKGLPDAETGEIPPADLNYDTVALALV